MILAGFLVATGCLFSCLLPIKLSFLERIFLGLSLGFIFFSPLVFLLALIFGFKIALHLGVLVFLTASMSLIVVKRKDLIDSLKKALPRVHQNRKFLFLLLVFSLTFFYLLHLQVLNPRPDGFYCGFLSFGDLPAHLAIVTNFVYGENFPPQNPFFAGTRLAYPFFADFLSATFVLSGSNLRESLIISSLIFFVSFLGLTFSFAKSFFRKSTALLGMIIFFMGTNLGHYYFFKDLLVGRTAFLRNFLENPKPYGGDFNIHLYNPMINLFVAERSFLPGLVLGITSLVLLYRGLRGKKINNFLWAGIFAGLLPFWHTHTFLSLAIFSFALFILYFPYSSISTRRKSKAVSYLKLWLIFFFPVAVLSLPQALYLLPQVAKTHFFHFQFGWMKGKDNFIFYWLKNGGVTLLLALVAFVFLRRTKQKFFLAAFFLFVVANLVIFQPWDYDNIKIFTFVFWFFSLLAAEIVGRIIRLKFWGKLAGFLLLFLITFNFFTQFYLERSDIRIFGKEEVESALWVREKTDSQTVFVTNQDHTNFVSSLAGRKSFLGYIGYLWTQGVPYAEREKLIPLLYQGGEPAKRIIDHFSLDYLLFSPRERKLYPDGYNYYQSYSQQVYESEHYALFKLEE